MSAPYVDCCIARRQGRLQDCTDGGMSGESGVMHI
jgi:hypothetical protein